MKVYKVVLTVINILLAVLYFAFMLVVSCMFELFPWYDSDGAYMLYMLVIWLPLCVVSLVQIVASVIAKRFNKGFASLICLNAVYIPLIFALGFVNISFETLKTICIIAVMTMILYVALSFCGLRKNK